MSIKKIIKFVQAFFLGSILSLNAFSENSFLQKDIKELLHSASTGFIYSYLNLNFDSTLPATYNRFYGNSDIYAVYESDVNLGDHLTGGLTYFRVTTNINAQLQLIDKPLVTSRQTITNNSIFGHVEKSYQDRLFFNLGGSFGLNGINTNSLFGTNTGYANTKNYNWFTTFIALYNNTWKDISYTLSGSILYSQINQGSSVFYFNDPNLTPTNIEPLITRNLFTSENLELGYKTEKNKLTFTPFVGVGLIQIPVYANSRPTYPIVNGALPQLFINQSGYRAVTGVTFSHHKFMIRLEEIYYNAGNVFTCYETVANLTYHMD
jgi:hypothetical protein